MHKRIDDKCIYIYGAGERGRLTYDLLVEFNIETEGFIDQNHAIQQNLFCGKSVFDPRELGSVDQATVIVSNSRGMKEIIDNLSKINPHITCITYTRLIKILYSDYICKADEEYIDSQKSSCVLLECLGGIKLGGLEKWNIQLVKAFTNDFQFEFISNGEIDSEWETASFIVNQIDVNSIFDTSKNTVNKLIEIIKKHIPCTVVCNHPNAAVIAAYAVKRAYPESIKIVQIVHWEHDDALDNVATLSDLTDIIVGVSEDTICRKLNQNYGITRDKLISFTCPITVNTDRTHYYLKDGIIRIGCACRFDYNQKRIDRIIDVASELKKRNIRFNLEFVGAGNYQSEMIRLIEHKGLNDVVAIKGLLKEKNMVEFWYGKDISINLSTWEGKSLSMLESMACGVINVVTDVSGVRDVIEDKKNGFIVSQNDYLDAVDIIELLSKNMVLLKEIGTKAKDSIAQNYSIEAMRDNCNSSFSI